MRLYLVTIGIALCASARAQTAPVFDNSGNGSLNGAYFLRQVLTVVDPSSGAITRAVAITGTMTFDGKGGYNFTGQKVDSTAGGSASAYSVSNGTYAAAANGLLQIQNPFDASDIDYGGIGGVGPSAIVASATEGSYLDVLVAIPISSSASNASVQGSFQTGFIDFLQGNASQVRDGYYTLTADGSGNFGNVSINGAMANQGSTLVNQMLSGVTYSLSNGAGTITFPTSATPLTALVSGSKAFYVSTDGNILLGGNTNGFDLMVGMKSLAGPASNSMFQGTYYNGALENDTTGGGNFIDSFYGSTLALGEGDHISHYRLRNDNENAFDFTEDGYTNLAADGTYNNGEFETILGAGGQAAVQIGISTYYTLTVYFEAQQYTGSAPFINPVKIWNAASYAPITNSVAPGEYVSIFGTGLASTPVTAQSYPLLTTLGNVQVMVNGVAAPLDYVSPTQINLVVPYETPAYSFATFQVINNKIPSNQVTVYTSGSSPGVFSTTSNGIGPAAVTHADGSLVTQSSPAVGGETVVLYVTGLGKVNPPVADGVAAPAPPPLSYTVENINVDIQDTDGNIYPAATPAFAGLTPGFAGLYQINFVVPTGVPSGLQWVNVDTQDGYTSEARIYMK
ncbi:MAG TPA: hypothetical protein VMH05_06255 [Bryobacteraceae bacterium]|nr:hypothetical protein [Bryobacteraceae bacterium]